MALVANYGSSMLCIDQSASWSIPPTLQTMIISYTAEFSLQMKHNIATAIRDKRDGSRNLFG